MNGDTAAAEGGLAAGCRFFAGYPITPATEVAERMAERLPEIEGGLFIQMEDEMASMNAVLGAAWGGKKSMTATSGPGFSLMMENLGLGIMLETPCVLVNVQRAGPSTGLPTLVGQQDMMQARWGSHGDYGIIALSPNSPQEAFDLTVRAFNLSEKYRVPVLLMTDEVVGHMFEKVVIPPKENIHIVNRTLTPPDTKVYYPFKRDKKTLVPPMAHAGDGYRIHVTGLTHDERGYPAVTAEGQAAMVPFLREKILKNVSDICDNEEVFTDDAEIIFLSFGIASRSTRLAVDQARKKGVKAGFFRLKTVWPFPEDRIRELGKQVKGIVVVEINLGQIVLEVERIAGKYCHVALAPNPGGRVHEPEEILAIAREVLK